MPTDTDQLRPTLAGSASESSDLVSGEWDLLYQPLTWWTGWFGGIPDVANSSGIYLPSGEYDLEIHVSGGITISGIRKDGPYFHMEGRLIGPGGIDSGPYAYHPHVPRSLPVSVVRLIADGRGGYFQIPVWTAPSGNALEVNATVRVQGNARFAFTRDVQSSPINGFFIGDEATITGAQSGRLTARRVRPAELRVDCTPNPVARGEEVACTARTDAPNARIEVEKWWFVGTDSRGETFTYQQEDVPTTSWRGEMAMSGTIHVRASVDGANPVEDFASAVVTNRNWSNESIPYNVQEVSFEEFPSLDRPALPPRSVRDLGAISMKGTALPHTAPGVVRYIQDDGPNSLLAYLARIPMEAEALILVSPAMREGSEFYREQLEKAPDYSSTPRCLRRDFARFVELIRLHEGLPPNPESHSGGIHHGVVDPGQVGGRHRRPERPDERTVADLGNPIG